MRQAKLCIHCDQQRNQTTVTPLCLCLTSSGPKSNLLPASSSSSSFTACTSLPLDSALSLKGLSRGCAKLHHANNTSQRRQRVCLLPPKLHACPVPKDCTTAGHSPEMSQKKGCSQLQ
jgi:hypothetical protein